jgi:hypothetical protein
MAEGPGEQVQLSLDRYAKLMAAARQKAGALATWGRGTVRVQIAGEYATVTVRARVQPTGEGSVPVSVLPAEVVLLGVEVDGSEATLLPLAGTHALLLTGGDSVTVTLRYRVKAQTGADGAAFGMVPLPPVPGSDVQVDGASGVRIWPGSGAGNTAQIPASPAMLVRWGDASPRDLVRKVNYELSPDAGGDGVDVVATFQINTQGQGSRVRVAKAEAALIDVRMGNTPVRTRVVAGWHTALVDQAGAKTLTATYRLAIDRTRGQPQVVLSPDSVPVARVQLSVPGKREVQFEPSVPTKTVIKGEGDAAQTTAIAHLPPRDAVTLRWTEARAAPESQVRVIAHSYQLLTLEEGFLKGTVHLRYEITNGKLKELPIELPEGIDVYKVEGEGIEDWQTLAKTDDAPRQLRVVLGEATEGSFKLKVQLEQNVNTEVAGTAIALPVLSVLSASRQEGVVALFDGKKVGFAPAEDGKSRFRKVGQDALPSDIRQTLRNKVNQAYKFINQAGPLRSKVAPAQAGDVRFDARVDTLYTLSEGSLTGNAAVLVEIKSGRRDTLIVSLPAQVAEPRITAPSLNKVEPTDFDAGTGRKAYAVRFTQALEGAIQLDVEFELLLAKDLDVLGLPELRVHEAEVESGSFGLTAETGMEVRPGELKDLRRVTVEELPKAVRLRSDAELVFGFSYARAPWGLQLTLKRNKTVETLNAVGSHVWLETNALDNGHIVSRATYEIINDDRRYVRLTLPEGAEVLSVSVGSDKVKAVADETGAIAIPLPKNQTVLVDLMYEVVRDKLGGVGSLALLAPRADLRTSDIQWLVRYPGRLALFNQDSDLSSAPAHQWQGSPLANENQAVALPVQADLRGLLFTYAVQEPAGGPEGNALSIGIWFTSGGNAFEPLVFGLALLLLVVAVRRLASGRGGWVWVILGAGLLVVKASIWSLEPGEAVLAMVVVLAVGVWTRRQRKQATAEAA